MKKLRVSYSLLSAWARSRPDEAVSIYFHTDQFQTVQMKAGKKIHEDIAEFTRKEGLFPKWLTPITPRKPLPEQKIIVPYNEMFDLSFICDCLDTPNLYEWKTGNTDSLEWAREMQIPFYFLGLELAKIPVEKAFLVRYNQYKRTSDWTLIWNNQTLKDEARNFIDSLAPEVHQYFTSQGLI